MPFRFARGYLDEETGLQKHGVRYYGMGQARFTQVDPVFGQITDPITQNAYEYAACDPANSMDPTGATHTTAECVSFVVAGGIAAIAGIVGIFATGGVALALGIGSAVLGTISFVGSLQAGCLSPDEDEG